MDRAESSYWRGQLARKGAACAAACGCLLASLLILSRWSSNLPVLPNVLAAGLGFVAAVCGWPEASPAASEAVQPEPPQGMLSRPGDWRYFAEAHGRLGAAADTALGCAEVLTAETRALPMDRRAEFSRALVDNCRTVSALARELGDLLRLADGELALAEQQIDAADLAEVAVKRCLPVFEREDVTITVDLLDGVELRGDSFRLRQALEGLLLQAAASARTGALGLRLTRGAGGALSFTLRFDAPPETGGGGGGHLPPQPGGPHGLGLPVARQIALLHGGDVTVTPVRAHGTELCLHLPASRVTWPQLAGCSGSSAA